MQCIIGGLSLEKLECGGTDSSYFLKAKECLWNSKEHMVVDLSPPVPGNLHRDKGLSMDGFLIGRGDFGVPTQNFSGK